MGNVSKGEFYTVATPIGNLGDISSRALDILNSVDIIACEDKRVSSVLLSKFSISKPLIVYQKHNEQEASAKISEIIESGKNVALISDAGTPCISDPGKIIVKKLFQKGIKTTSIPGACAISTILSCAPRMNESFAFYGFLPRTKNEQQEVFEKFSNIDLVFYESPKRLLTTLENIMKYRGPDQKIAVGRELTKKFEETIYNTVACIYEHFSNINPKGEIACILYKNENHKNNDYTNEIKKLLKEGYSSKDIAIIISSLYGANKKEIYKTANCMK